MPKTSEGQHNRIDNDQWYAFSLISLSSFKVLYDVFGCIFLSPDSSLKNPTFSTYSNLCLLFFQAHQA